MKLFKNIALASVLPVFYTCVAICDVGTKRNIPDSDYWTGEIVVLMGIFSFSLSICGFLAGRSSKD
jgi:hypothetical protein